MLTYELEPIHLVQYFELGQVYHMQFINILKKMDLYMLTHPLLLEVMLKVQVKCLK